MSRTDTTTAGSTAICDDTGGAGGNSEVKLACPSCGSTALATQETIAARLFTDGIFRNPDGSADPRWSHTLPETFWDSSQTVGVSCTECSWLYIGDDWVDRLASATVVIVLHGRESVPVPLTGDQTATILINEVPALGVTAEGTVGTWPDGQTWQRIDDITEVIAFPPHQGGTRLAVEVSGVAAVSCSFGRDCEAEVCVSGTLAAHIAHDGIRPARVASDGCRTRPSADEKAPAGEQTANGRDGR